MDVLGLVIAVVVLAASVHDNAFRTALLAKVAAGGGGTVTKALVDQGFKSGRPQDCRTIRTTSTSWRSSPRPMPHCVRGWCISSCTAL